MDAKTELLALEEAGDYVFHGSPNGGIELFEPKQAVSHGIKDGKPCVAAAEYVDPAIFMSIFSGKVHCGWDSNSPDGFGFYLQRSDFEKIKNENCSGYVYVFRKADHKFEQHQDWEWRTHTKVKPLKRIQVKFSDLPRNILLY